jgi:hypothetical protein
MTEQALEDQATYNLHNSDTPPALSGGLLPTYALETAAATCPVSGGLRFPYPVYVRAEGRSLRNG